MEGSARQVRTLGAMSSVWTGRALQAESDDLEKLVTEAV
jgi:hypothetical protein